MALEKEKVMKAEAGTFTSPRFIIAAALAVVATVALFMTFIDALTWKWAIGVGVGGYMLNNGIKGVLVKK